MVSIKERFIVFPDVLVNNDQMVILTDYKYWTDNEDTLRAWCKDNHSDFVGMTVTFPNQQTLTAFLLRWQ